MNLGTYSELGEYGAAAPEVQPTTAQVNLTLAEVAIRSGGSVKVSTAVFTVTAQSPDIYLGITVASSNVVAFSPVVSSGSSTDVDISEVTTKGLAPKVGEIVREGYRREVIISGSFNREIIIEGSFIRSLSL